MRKFAEDKGGYVFQGGQGGFWDRFLGSNQKRLGRNFISNLHIRDKCDRTKFCCDVWNREIALENLFLDFFKVDVNKHDWMGNHWQQDDG